MKPYKLVIPGILLIVSLACGLQLQPGDSSVPTSVPGAVNTYIVQTAAVAGTQTASAAPPTSTSTSTPLVTETPLPAINVYIELSQIDSDSLLIIGQLTGALAETDYLGYATLRLYDSQSRKLLEYETPCAQTPHEGDKLCLFVFSISELPADFSSYQITGEIRLSNGLTLTGQMEGAFAGEAAQANAAEGSATQIFLTPPQPVQPAAPLSKEDVSVNASFSTLFYFPENGSSLSAHATYFGGPANATASNVELCASIVEHRKYESGKAAQVVLTDECKPAYFSGTDKTANASADFFFKPSGFGFVSIESPDGRYRILEVHASVTLKQNRQVLATSELSHRPVPARVIETSLYPNSQAAATVEIMSGQGETYDLALRVYQVEGDPDEIFWSSILFFTPCLLPEICDDRQRVGESFKPIELTAGTKATINVAYSAIPVSEEGNFIFGYEMLVYFEDIVIGRK